MSENSLTIEKYKSKSRKVTKIQWPGGEKEIGILQLNFSEIQESYFYARETFAKKGYQKIENDNDEFDNEKLIQRVYRFLVDPESCTGEKKYRIFRDPDECKQMLTVNEMIYFATKYLEAYG